MVACRRCTRCDYQLEYNFNGTCLNCGLVIDKELRQKYLTYLCRKAINHIGELKR